MPELSVRTKGNSSPSRKPRVYFCCHPDDFDRYFDKLCEDIFATHDCAIYYTSDMTSAFSEELLDTDLGSSNLFVVPVTFKLLSSPNRAMDSDLAYAKKHHIAILPFMMESGIDEFYSAPEKFGELQYINPYASDATEISYAEKLKKYLEAVLISDEMAKRVREAFDAYIFLSYRKKDRKYANQLMRIIHEKEKLRDIAIWYDEFLTPGESFKENIERALKDSKLFTLLVTPNLLEEPNGKPNFVMGEEYPAARDRGMNILPVEMQETDKSALAEKYAEIPRCVNPQDNEMYEQLLETLSKAAVAENDSDPEHNFLIGLAYLDGIDVEVNRERGVKLVTSAAEANLPEAMKKLHNMYSNGEHVAINYREAVRWAERLSELYTEKYGEEDRNTLLWLGKLAMSYADAGEYKKALELSEKAYSLHCKIFGEEHSATLTSLNNFSVAISMLGNHEKTLELDERVYSLRCKLLGEEHPATLTSLSNITASHVLLGNYEKALEIGEKSYQLHCKVYGEEHPKTLKSLNNFSLVYSKLGNYEKALELDEKIYSLRCKLLGEEHPDTLSSLSNLAYNYCDLGDLSKGIMLYEKLYFLRSKVLGEEHPDTVSALGDLSITYYQHSDYSQAVKYFELTYDAYMRIEGESGETTQFIRMLMNVSRKNAKKAARKEFWQKLFHKK